VIAYVQQFTENSVPLRAFWGEDALLRAVTAGDDYQIAFTAPPSQASRLRRETDAVSMPRTRPPAKAESPDTYEG